jgi:hypothetical protein
MISLLVGDHRPPSAIKTGPNDERQIGVRAARLANIVSARHCLRF